MDVSNQKNQVEDLTPWLNLACEMVRQEAEDLLDALRSKNEGKVKKAEKWLKKNTLFYTCGRVHGEAIIEHIRLNYEDPTYKIGSFSYASSALNEPE